MIGLCCHFCNSIQWTETIYDYSGVVMDLNVKKKGKIRIIACKDCPKKGFAFVKSAFSKPKNPPQAVREK